MALACAWAITNRAVRRAAIAQVPSVLLRIVVTMLVLVCPTTWPTAPLARQDSVKAVSVSRRANPTESLYPRTLANPRLLAAGARLPDVVIHHCR